VVAALAVITLVSGATAQNIMRLRFDTVTAHPGDIVTLNVYYTFSATHGHDIQDVRVRMRYDTNLVWPVKYILDGTASASFYDTTTSHLGILAIGQGQEMDFTNPVLLRIQFRVDSALSDTAWIRWDSDYKYATSVFELSSDGVDSVTFEDGWIRVPAVASVLSAPSEKNLTIFPNPAKDEVMLSLPDVNSGESVMLEVFDALGRLCWHGSTAYPLWRIPASLPNGAYTLRVESGETAYRTRLVIGP